MSHAELRPRGFTAETSMSLATLDAGPDRGAAPPPPRASAGFWRALVRCATLAPSNHNSQPWRFRVCDAGLELRADRARALRVADPRGRELVISCGAALAFLRVSAAHTGYALRVRPLPEPGDPDLLARVALARPCEPRTADEACYAAMRRRCTDRRDFDGRPVPEPELAALVATTLGEGAWLRLVTDEWVKGMVAGLVEEADRRLHASPAYRRELAAWLRPLRPREGDGIPVHALGVGLLASVALPRLVRARDLGEWQGRRDGWLIAAAPALLLLGTDGDADADWLHAGQALGFLLLEAAARGLSTSFFNAPLEIADLRTRLARALGVPGFPQLLLRVGYPTGDLPGTPRRGLAEVLER